MTQTISIIETFRAHANAELAVAMQAYMRHQFIFLGLKKPERVKLQREWIKETKQLCQGQIHVSKLPSCKDSSKTTQNLHQVVLSLWHEDEREFQYLALDLMLACKDFLNSGDLPLIETLITEKSWWDTVDMLASGILGPMSAREPQIIQHYLLPWAASDNLWLRRTAILFQLKSKVATDTALLSEIILMNCGTSEFFLNKAIGWILREYSKTDPKWVRMFLDEHPLHPLSVREASKYL